MLTLPWLSAVINWLQSSRDAYRGNLLLTIANIFAKVFRGKTLSHPKLLLASRRITICANIMIKSRCLDRLYYVRSFSWLYESKAVGCQLNRLLIYIAYIFHNNHLKTRFWDLHAAFAGRVYIGKFELSRRQKLITTSGVVSLFFLYSLILLSWIKLLLIFYTEYYFLNIF